MSALGGAAPKQQPWSSLAWEACLRAHSRAGLQLPAFPCGEALCHVRGTSAIHPPPQTRSPPVPLCSPETRNGEASRARGTAFGSCVTAAELDKGQCWLELGRPRPEIWLCLWGSLGFFSWQVWKMWVIRVPASSASTPEKWVLTTHTHTLGEGEDALLLCS